MAGVLYLFRLFVYHAENLGNRQIHDLLLVMEGRLMKYITRPAMVISWIAGLAIALQMPSIVSGHWFYIKLFFVIALTFTSEKGGGYVRKFRAYAMDEQKQKLLPSSKRFRFYNEIPTVLMLIIVALVVFKPF